MKPQHIRRYLFVQNLCIHKPCSKGIQTCTFSIKQTRLLFRNRCMFPVVCDRKNADPPDSVVRLMIIGKNCSTALQRTGTGFVSQKPHYVLRKEANTVHIRRDECDANARLYGIENGELVRRRLFTRISAKTIPGSPGVSSGKKFSGIGLISLVRYCTMSS